MSGAILKAAVDGALMQQICDAFGITSEEVNAIDWLMHGPEIRAERKREEWFFEQYTKARAAELNALLPEGLELKWEPIEREGT